MKNITKQPETSPETKLTGFNLNTLPVEQQLHLKGGLGLGIDPSGSN